MVTENVREQESLASVYAKVVMKQTSGTLKDKYIAGVLALMGPNAEDPDARVIATKVYETIESYLGEMPREANPTQKLYDLCKIHDWNELDAVELVMEVEGEFDVSIPHNPDPDHQEYNLSPAQLTSLIYKGWKKAQEVKPEKVVRSIGQILDDDI